MPSNVFDVESYTVLTNQRGTAPAGAWRILTLASPDLAHGIRNRATIYFFESPGSLGVVHNVDQPNFNGQTAYAYCRKADFADWYDMLRNEKPLRFSYTYDGPEFDSNLPVRLLTNVQLYTGQPEPPGEGAEGVQARRIPAEMLKALKKAKRESGGS